MAACVGALIRPRPCHKPRSRPGAPATANHSCCVEGARCQPRLARQRPFLRALLTAPHNQQASMWSPARVPVTRPSILFTPMQRHKRESRTITDETTVGPMPFVSSKCCRAHPPGTTSPSRRRQQRRHSRGFCENSSARPRSFADGGFWTPSRRAQFPHTIVAARKTQTRIRDTVSVVKSTVPIDFVPKSSEPVTSRPTGFNSHSQPDNFHRFQVTPPDRRILGCNKSSAN